MFQNERVSKERQTEMFDYIDGRNIFTKHHASTTKNYHSQDCMYMSYYVIFNTDCFDNVNVWIN